MSEVVVVGSFKAEPGKEAEAFEAFQALVEPTHAEDGCILYALHQGSDDPSRLAFVERWESSEHLDAHMATEHLRALTARMPELLSEAPDIVAYLPLPAGDPAKGTLAGQAG